MIPAAAGAIISPCGTYRYALWRTWDSSPGFRPLRFVMLNPSTADSCADDPTIRRCVGFAKTLGFGGIEVYNLSAFRATDPKALRAAGNPVGPDNDAWLAQLAVLGGPVVCAWGANARGWGRADQVVEMLTNLGVDLAALDFTSDGIPRHPLMLRADCTLKPYGRTP